MKRLVNIAAGIAVRGSAGVGRARNRTRSRQRRATHGGNAVGTDWGPGPGP